MDERWKSAVEQFLRGVRARSDSEVTEYHYRLFLRRFLAEHPDPGAVTSRDVHSFAYAATKTGRPPSPATIGSRLTPLRSFFAHLVEWDLVRVNPALRVKRPPIQEGKPRARPVGEIASLIAAVAPAVRGTRLSEPRAARDRALIISSYYTLMRRAEILRLRGDSVRGDWSRGSEAAYAVIKCKGGRTRKFHVAPPVLDAIHDSLSARGKVLADVGPHESLFGPVSISTFRAAVVRAAKYAGIGLVTPHDLRRSGARRRFELTHDLEGVQAQLGHSRLSTTQTYIKREAPPTDVHWRTVRDDLKRAGGE